MTTHAIENPASGRMMVPEPDEFERLLAAARTGDREALNRIMPLVYDELRRIARRQLARERPGHTFDSSALVHEAYLKLERLQQIKIENRVHFAALAARLMRRILIDHANGRDAAKRGGGEAALSLDDVTVAVEDRFVRYAALEEALERLEAQSPRQCQVVECRYFAGLSNEETAEALNVSLATVKRDWMLARAWLNKELA